MMVVCTSTCPHMLVVFILSIVYQIPLKMLCYPVRSDLSQKVAEHSYFLQRTHRQVLGILMWIGPLIPGLGRYSWLFYEWDFHFGCICLDGYCNGWMENLLLNIILTIAIHGMIWIFNVKKISTSNLNKNFCLYVCSFWVPLKKWEIKPYKIL